MKAIQIYPNTWFQDDQIIFTGTPTPIHDCDEMGCNSLEHVIRRVRLAPGFLEVALRAAVIAELDRQERLAERWS
jgi:hypothetical protein